MGKKDNELSYTQMILGSNATAMYPSIETVDGINKTIFPPVGTIAHQVQHLMSTRLHDAVMENPNVSVTLSELGYLFFNTIEMKNGRISVELYFDPRLATYEDISPNGQKSIKIKPQLVQILANRFIAVQETADHKIDLTGIIQIGKILCPQGKIVYNERGNASLKIKKDALDMKYREVVVVNCNFALTMAYLLNIDLMDESYATRIEAAGMNDKKTIRDMKNANDDTEATPVWIMVAWSRNGYRPEDAIPYLTKLASLGGNSTAHGMRILKEAEVEHRSKKDKRSDKKSAESKGNSKKSVGRIKV